MIGRERYDNLLSLLALDDGAVEAAPDDEHEPVEGAEGQEKAKKRGKRPNPGADSSAKKGKKGD